MTKLRMLAVWLVLLPACAREPRGVEWRQAYDVSSGAAPVLVSSDNTVTIGWVSAPDHGTDGRLVVRPDVRRDAAVEVHDPLGDLTIYGETPPKLAYGGDGMLYAVYLVTRVVPGDRWPQNALRFVASSDNGHRWSAPATVSNGFGSYDDHALEVGPDGTIYLSWLAGPGERYHTYVAASRDRGATWSTPTVVDTGASCPCCRTAMASGPDGALYIAWRKRYLGATPTDEVRDIVVARSADHGRSFSTPIRVHVDDWHVNYCPDAGPSLRVGANGVVHIAWWTGKPGAAGIQYARSTDRGATFGPAVPLGLAALSRAAHVQLAIGSKADSGVVLAAWDDGTRQRPNIVARVSRDGGHTFAQTQTLSAPDRAVGYPAVVLRADTALVAWQERSTTDAKQDSVTRSEKDPRDAATYINAVGAMHVVARQGIVQ
jgi:hypothetical protein